MKRSGKSLLLLVLFVATGIGLGIGGYTFLYAKGLSYMSSEPEVCVNCHIMQAQYDSWQKSSHHKVAVCIDCHLPHDFVGKYVAKAENGWHHSRAFTMQDFHEPIMMTEKNARILQGSCVSCHEDAVHEMLSGANGTPDEVRCVHCHATVGHGETTGLGGPEDINSIEEAGI